METGEKLKIDGKDLEILALLEADCSRTKKQIAKKLAVPLTTVHNRIAKLENSGVIAGYKARIDKRKLGFGVGAIVSITVNYITKDYSQEQTASKIMQLDGVEFVAIVTGTTDLIAKVTARDTDGLNSFLTHQLRKIPGIDKTTTLVVLKEYG